MIVNVGVVCVVAIQGSRYRGGPASQGRYNERWVVRTPSHPVAAKDWPPILKLCAGLRLKSSNPLLLTVKCIGCEVRETSGFAKREAKVGATGA